LAGYIIHRTSAGERWDLLAMHYYRDVIRQDVLIEANRALFAGLSVPAVLPAGLALRVPLVEAPVTDTGIGLPPWKR